MAQPFTVRKLWVADDTTDTPNTPHTFHKSTLLLLVMFVLGSSQDRRVGHGGGACNGSLDD